MRAQTQNTYFTSLDGIRGAAAIMIFFRHASPFMTEVLFHSYLAVDLFFVLSGFVLASVYDHKLEEKTLSAVDFFKTRIIRLYPLFFLSACVALGAALLTVTFWGWSLTGYAAWLKGMPLTIITSAFLFSLVMLPCIYSSTLYPLNGSAWTLFYELLINWFYALCRPFLSDKKLAFIVFLSGCSLIFYVLLGKTVDTGFFWRDIAAGILRTTYSFGSGVLLFKIREKYAALDHIKQNNFLAIILLGIVVTLLAVPSYPRLNSFYDLVVILFFFPFIVFIASYLEPHGGVQKYFRYLGQSSYGIYILHVPFSALIAISYEEVLNTKISSRTALVLLPILFLSVLALDRFLDQPFRKFLKQKALTSKV